MKVLVTPIPGGVGPGESHDFVLRDLEVTFPKVTQWLGRFLSTRTRRRLLSGRLLPSGRTP